MIIDEQVMVIDKQMMTRRRFVSKSVSAAAALSLSRFTFAKELPQVLTGPRIGMFYTSWWDERDRFGSWKRLHGPNQSTPVLGNYGAGDPKLIRRHYEMMRECGVDFLIFDDTNGIFVDDSIVDHNIKAWFDFMDKVPPKERIWLCIAFGGELNQHSNRKSFYDAADYLYKTYANRPSYWRREGRPFLLWYIERGTTDDDWQDPRWFIRRCYHFFRTDDQAKHEGWGWGSKPYPPPNKECMSFFPGWSFGDNPPIERRGGDYFMECWVRVLKAQPNYVAIADWNQWHERCAIEDTTDWGDTYGYSTPDWYRQIIQGYKEMSHRTLLSGWFYRKEEDLPTVYMFDGRYLVHQGEYPHRRPVLITPQGWFKEVPIKR